MSTPAIKDIQFTLSILPLAAFAYDKQTGNVFANAQAQQLFKLTNIEDSITHIFNHIQLFDTTNQQPLSNNDFFIPKKQLSVREVLITSSQSSTVIELNYSIVSTSLTLVICTKKTPSKNSYDADFDEVISKISTQIIDIQLDNLDAKIESALQTIGTFCNADRSYVFQFSESDKIMSNTHEWVNENITPFKTHLQNIPQNSLPYFFKMMSEQHVFNIPDVMLLPEEAHKEKTEFTAEDIKSILCIGLKSEQKLVGFIGCDCVKNTRNWNETDLIRIKLVGDIITNSLKNVSYKLRIEQIQQQLLSANEELQNLANLDSLTNIANRRQFDSTLKIEIQRSARSQQPISLIICDIDFFKLYNDNFGHQQGDEILKQVASTLQALTKRQGGLVSRYGGEEFAFILPITDKASCHNFATLIKSSINELAIAHPYSTVSEKLTLSIGYHCFIASKKNQADKLIKAADKALYKAKNAGRNKVMRFD
ncbi:diguanylate cyclase domain-containing protein [Pseudoalteromonas sp.]|uniref:sensor domain-containing diguanylate cyclase n=1 Tax=Pseudoalteromonas sp. TaxID=53249 RepID=UPI003F9E9F53